MRSTLLLSILLLLALAQLVSCRATWCIVEEDLTTAPESSESSSSLSESSISSGSSSDTESSTSSESSSLLESTGATYDLIEDGETSSAMNHFWLSPAFQLLQIFVAIILHIIR